MDDTKECEFCGYPFEPFWLEQKYCCKKCRQARNRAMVKQKKLNDHPDVPFKLEGLIMHRGRPSSTTYQAQYRR
jgi:hypothetical protein